MRKIIGLVSISLTMMSLPLFPQVAKQTRVGYPDGSYLSWPWAGGLNSCQIGETDVNGDGTKDLVVFDRTGNRLSCYLNQGVPGVISFVSGEDYAGYFPPVFDWMILADYDGDGKEDIFTYSPGYAGIKVYKNISAPGSLQFELVVSPYLTSYQGGGQVNILVTYADYPAISDLDGDGDLDILTFWGLGSFVEFHRNMSMEKFGHADSLDYIKTSFCWGYFAESEESNLVTLDTCIGWKPISLPAALTDRHTGSTFLVLDLDGNGLKDLLLGDVDYPNLVALFNGGTLDTAVISEYEWDYPQAGPPVHLYSMPSASCLDVDNDGRRDLICSPFDPSPYLSANFESVWLYLDASENSAPVFQLSKRNFLQEGMIDLGAGAYPALVDYNGDGLMDIVAGNYGYYDTSYLDEYYFLHTEQTGKLALFVNNGTQGNPAYDFADRDFAGISSLGTTGIVPTFGDLDGDGDKDILLGCAEGTLHFYRNEAQPGQPMELIHQTGNFQGIDVGSYSAPCLFDMDQDGLADLVVGEKAGNLNYYHNDGPAGNPSFNLVTDSLGKINVTDYTLSLDGFSVPCLFRHEGSDDVDLLVGSESGKVFCYESIQNHPGGTFPESGNLGADIGIPGFANDRGFRSAPLLISQQGDDTPDLVCGNFCGGLEYFDDVEQPVVSGVDEAAGTCPVSVFPVPANQKAFVDGAGVDFRAVRLYDPVGKLVGTYTAEGQGPVRIDLERLTPGIYILQCDFYLDSMKGLRHATLKLIHD